MPVMPSKISDYANSGYILGRNFIATFETANLINANCIDSLIKVISVDTCMPRLTFIL